MPEEPCAIRVQNLTKEFIIPHKKANSIKQLFVGLGRQGRVDRRKVLNDISFEIKKGEFFGIVGRNGSGKSTLLKILAGVYIPTKGKVGVNGSLTPFIELGVGFNPELTGRENVFLNGALLGFTHKQMGEMYEDIVDFAELQEFMDQKLKNYSSGMQVRLAFSIAIRAKSDILLIDEVLAVGDAAFQKKCLDYFTKLKSDKKTVIFVSHDMSSIEKYCTAGIMIDRGKIVCSGAADLIAAKYKLENLPTSKINKLSKNIKINKVTINSDSEVIIDSNDPIKIEIFGESFSEVDFNSGLSLIKSDGSYVAYFNSKNTSFEKTKKGSSFVVSCDIDPGQLLGGAYSVDVAIYDLNDIYLDKINNAVKFAVKEKNIDRDGSFKIKGSWSLRSH